MTNQNNPYIDLLDHVVCNQCGADDFEVIYPPDYSNAKSEDLKNSFRSSGDELLLDQLVKCRVCGLQYLNPRIKQDVVLEAYSDGSDETFISQASARERTFASCLNTIEKNTSMRGKILDVGTAGGSFLSVAKQRGWQVFGCEPNRWLCQWAGEHYGVEITPGTIFDMKVEDESMDVVTLWDVLEHTPDPKAVLLECHRILKRGGLLVVNYPDIGSLIARLMGRKWVFLLSVHLYYFTLPTITKMLESNGYKVTKHQMHWQSLELGYIFFRMKPYIPWLSKFGMSLTRMLKLEQTPIPYWMGQSLVLAERQ